MHYQPGLGKPLWRQRTRRTTLARFIDLHLETLLITQVEHVAAELTRSSLGGIATNRLRTGAWSNDNGIITAYLSYQLQDDPAADNLEVVYTIVPADEGLRFTVDICQPDGEVLSEILDSYVVFSTEAVLVSELSQLGEIAGRGTLSRLKAMILPI